MHACAAGLARCEPHCRSCHAQTTLLSSLAGRDVNASVEGKVLVGGRAPDRFFKRVACFVPQEDSLMGVLTVHETLQFAAALAGYTDKDARDRLVCQCAVATSAMCRGSTSALCVCLRPCAMQYASVLSVLCRPRAGGNDYSGAGIGDRDAH